MITSLLIACNLLAFRLESQPLIVFVSDRDGNDEIYVMNPDGTGQRRLTDNPAKDMNPSWINGGKRIAWASNRTGQWDIYTMDTDGTGIQNVTSSAKFEDTYPFWCDRWSQIHFISNQRPYTIDPRYEAARMLTGYVVPQDCHPTLHPDGSTCLTTDKNGKLIYMTTWNIAHPFPLDYTIPNGPRAAYHAQFSPDGLAVAFDTGGPKPDLYTVETTGENVERVSMEGHGYDPAWANDSNSLVFTSKVGADGKTEVCMIDFDAVLRTKEPPKPVNLTNSLGNDKEPNTWLVPEE